MTRREHRAYRRWAAVVGLVGWALATLVVPGLHQQHHARFGTDHAHDPLTGAVFTDEHHAFDADLAALELSDVAHAGVAVIDCELAAYTLADDLATCDANRSFADAALDRSHHHPAQDHGDGGLLHLGVAVLLPSTPMLPPPSLPHDAAFAAHISTPHQPAFRRHYASRAPPA